ncbi:MAG: hypothetical protein ACPLXS_03720 [Candidatus Micrarchaeales archaeon]
MKLQFWSLDAIISLAIFLLALISLILIWQNVVSGLATSLGYSSDILLEQANLLTKRLMSQGYPSNWETIINPTLPNTWPLISIGISKDGKRIDQNKLLAFIAISSFNYSKSKQLLGVGFDYFIRINSKDISIQIGKNPLSFNAINIQKVSIPIIIANENGKMDVYVWSNSTISAA